MSRKLSAPYILSTLALAVLLHGGTGCSDDGQGPAIDQGLDDLVLFETSDPDTGTKDLAADATGDQGADSSSDMMADTSQSDTIVDGAGDTSVGDTAAGDTVAGDTAAGDTAAGDTGSPADAMTGDGTKVTCATGETIRVEEVGTGTDFVVLKNTGTTQVDIGGYKLIMDGIATVTYTLPTGTKLAAGAKVYILEYSAGSGSNVLFTGANIPFYDGISSNALAFYNATGQLVDYLAMGTKIVGLPGGISATIFAWPSGFNASTDSVQRTGTTGVCPSFVGSDWTGKTATKPNP